VEIGKAQLAAHHAHHTPWWWINSITGASILIQLQGYARSKFGVSPDFFLAFNGALFRAQTNTPIASPPIRPGCNSGVPTWFREVVVDLDPVLLSRFQFAWLIGWHILMPAFTVGMASYIAILEGLYFATCKQIYLRISVFWIRIFSVAFGVGVVSGVIMPFEALPSGVAASGGSPSKPSAVPDRPSAAAAPRARN